MKNLRKHLPVLNGFEIKHAQNRIDEEIRNRWNPNIRAKAEEKNNVITIYEVIGEDFWTGQGFTAKRMSAALRSIGKENDVVVSVNSPGGDFFEGAAIYNLLREHEGKVTVQIIGLAASAASFIAMAGDDIQISDIGFYMIHDVWSFVCGNKNDLREVADTYQMFDEAIADIYAKRSGYEKAEIVEMMSKDTWMNASDAVDKGFADQKMDEEVVDDPDDGGEKKARAMARRSVELALARDGISRKERENILNTAFGKRDAAGAVVRDADQNEDGLKDLLKTMKTGG